MLYTCTYDMSSDQRGHCLFSTDQRTAITKRKHQQSLYSQQLSVFSCHLCVLVRFLLVFNRAPDGLPEVLHLSGNLLPIAGCT